MFFIIKRRNLLATILLILVLLTNRLNAQQNNFSLGKGNPFFTKPFFADPSVKVIDGKVYIYPSQDAPHETDYRQMDGYHVLTSDDLVTWKDHGEFLRSKQIPWVKNSMWAPEGGVMANSKYYFYFPARDSSEVFNIAVVTSNYPTMQNWTYQKRIEGVRGIDPMVFFDDDGKTYLYWAARKMARLKSNMIELDEKPIEVETPDFPIEPLNDRGLQPKSPREGQWVFKKDGIYYRVYNSWDNRCQWTTSKSPYGPFKYRGPLMSENLGGAQGHGSIIQFKGQWYYFYHITSPEKDPDVDGSYARTTCADIVHFHDDGSIEEVKRTSYGVGRYNGDLKIEAENYFEKSSDLIYRDGPDDGFHIANATNGDWLKFPKVDFGNDGKKAVKINYQGTNKAEVLIAIDKKDNTISTLHTLKSLNYEIAQGEIKIIKGVHDVWIKVKSNNGALINLDWLKFE